MKALALFVLLSTPKQSCIDKVNHDNVGNCREEPTDQFHFSNGILCQGPGGFYGICEGADKKGALICEKVKNPKPVPESGYKFSLEMPPYPDDDCYDYKIGKIEFPEVNTFNELGFVVGAPVSISSVSSIGSGIIRFNDFNNNNKSGKK